jgi:transcriptional regulator with XRE-family HTH domain
MEIDDADYKKAVGYRVKRLRLGAGATQDVLADRCGIYRTYLSRIEAGAANPTLVVLASLAAALNVRLCDLFCDPGTTPHPALAANPSANPNAL